MRRLHVHAVRTGHQIVCLRRSVDHPKLIPLPLLTSKLLPGCRSAAAEPPHIWWYAYISHAAGNLAFYKGNLFFLFHLYRLGWNSYAMHSSQAFDRPIKSCEGRKRAVHACWRHGKWPGLAWLLCVTEVPGILYPNEPQCAVAQQLRALHRRHPVLVRVSLLPSGPRQLQPGTCLSGSLLGGPRRPLDTESASLQSQSQTPTRGQANATRKQRAEEERRKERKEERQKGRERAERRANSDEEGKLRRGGQTQKAF